MRFRVVLAIAAIACSGVEASVVLSRLQPKNMTLPSLVRAFSFPDFDNMNLYKAAESLTTGQCPSDTLIHRTVGKCTKTKTDVLVIPHEVIYQDGEQCGTGLKTEYLTVVSGEDVIDARTARTNGLLRMYGVVSSNARAANALKVLQGLHPVFVGVEMNGPRICGEKIMYGLNTVFFFLRPDVDTQDLNFGFAYLGISETGVVSVRTDEQLCLYKETRRLGPGQGPFATPTPSPRPWSALSESVFDLDDPASIGPCFPAEKVVAASPTPGSTSSSSGPTPATISPAASSTPSRSPPQPENGGNSGAPASPTAGLTNSTASQSPNSSKTVLPSPIPSEPLTSPSPSMNNSDDPACFPSVARVVLKTGKHIPISKLEIGDVVQTGPTTYSEVFMFTHQVRDVRSTFVRLGVDGNTSLALSRGHYVPVNGRLKAAMFVAVGDTLLLDNGGIGIVTSSQASVLDGLYNPQTMDGQIAINGVITSTFTQAVNPRTALSLLSPVKFVYKIFASRVGYRLNLAKGNPFIASVLPRGGLLDGSLTD